MADPAKHGGRRALILGASLAAACAVGIGCGSGAGTESTATAKPIRVDPELAQRTAGGPNFLVILMDDQATNSFKPRYMPQTFHWIVEPGTDFVDGIAALEASTGLAFAVENMYPWRASGRSMEMYLPGWDPSDQPYANTTIDLSHAAIAHDDVVAMAERLGERLRHIHLTDGTGSAKDEHLVPGRGSTGADEFLRHLASTGFGGEVVLEINTRKCATRAERERDLRESLDFAREHLAVGTP